MYESDRSDECARVQLTGQMGRQVAALPERGLSPAASGPSLIHRGDLAFPVFRASGSALGTWPLLRSLIKHAGETVREHAGSRMGPRGCTWGCAVRESNRAGGAAGLVFEVAFCWPTHEPKKTRQRQEQFARSF